MKFITTLVLAGLIAAAASQMASAQLIAGNIGFVGEIVVNSTQASLTTKANFWNGMEVIGNPNGSFATAGITQFASASFAGSWNFNDTTPVTNFWTIGNFSFTLQNSFIDPTGTGGTAGHSSIKVDVEGTVSGNNYTSTPYSGTLTFADPTDGDGPNDFLAQWSFQPVPVPVPEPAPALLLGAALPVFALVKRKLKG